jgi:hypothetical protein
MSERLELTHSSRKSGKLGTEMFGVVLWSDRREKKAVIWCEDHGDLAFYRQAEETGPVPLDAGDWVQFDMTTDSNLRFAHNPRLVAEGVYAGLAEVLGRRSAGTDAGRQRTADVVPFTPRRDSGRPGAACCA